MTKIVTMAKSTTNHSMILPDHLLARVFSFCDPSDYISLLRASYSIFSQPLQIHVRSRSSLSFSFLLRLYPNRISDVDNNSAQQTALEILWRLLTSHGPSTKLLKHVEFSNLRGATGQKWLPRLVEYPIVSLDLSNIVRLDIQLLASYLWECPTTLRHLFLTGNGRVNSDIVDIIGQRHSQILSLSLGSCSQSIRTGSIFALLKNLRKLEHLDLQGLKNVHDGSPTDPSNNFFSLLPDTLKSLNLGGTQPLLLYSMEIVASCDRLQSRILEFGQAAVAFRNFAPRRQPPNFLSEERVQLLVADLDFRIKLEHLVLDGMGYPRSGICNWVVGTLSHGNSLRTVQLSGCETVDDLDILALAYNCGATLTSFQITGGSIGDLALDGLARRCKVLAEVDISGCFNVGDEGVIGLCEMQSQSFHETSQEGDPGSSSSKPSKRQRLSDQPSLPSGTQWPKASAPRRSPLKVLKVANLPNLTDRAVEALSNLESLLVLDLHGCPKVTPAAVHSTVQKLPRLVEVNAKDIALQSPSLCQRLRQDENATNLLKFVNERVFITTSNPGTDTKKQTGCCTILSHSQRLSAAVPLQSMYHCVDCRLLPTVDRGICSECVQKCHQRHKTFLGAYTRFYCDCAFGVAATNSCEAMP